MSDAREGVELDLGVLEDWIGDRLPGTGEPLTAERLGADSGIANALYFVRRAGHEWVLRRPPAIKNHPSASDTGREWRILQALEGTPVPHPAPRLFCDDPDVLGATFMIMDRVQGFTPGTGLPPPFDSDPEAQRGVAMAYVDGLVELSKVDWVAGGLVGLGKPEGFLERQVSRWLSQLDGYRVRSLPEEDFLCGWLEANRPEMSPPAILHGDYSPYNVMVANDLPARLAAIIDWDTGTIGDPLLDIGHLTARWNEPDEEPVLGTGDLKPGYPTRAEMAARYTEGTGRDLSALPYYQALSLFKLGVILEGNYARATKAGVPDGENRMTGAAPGLFRGAAAFARPARGPSRFVADSLQDKRRRYVSAEIARTALRLFAEKGFDEVTIDEIAAAAGMSSRTFFRYYATKEDVVLQYQRRTQERLLTALAGRPPEEGPVTALREAYLATSTVAPEDRETVRMQSRFMSGSRTLEARAHGARAVEAQPVIELLAERMGVDPATDPRPRTVAVSMGAAAAAAFHAWVLEGGKGDPAADLAAALALLEDGLSSLDVPVRTGRPKSA